MAPFPSPPPGAGTPLASERAATLARIEGVALQLLEHGYVRAAARRPSLGDADENEDGDAPGEEGDFQDGVGSALATRRGDAPPPLALRSAAVRRALHVLAVAHELVSQGSTATVREVFYRGKRRSASPHDGFETEGEVASAVELAARLCGVPRASLGLYGASKGWFCGPVEWRSLESREWRGATSRVTGAHEAVAVPERAAELEVRHAAGLPAAARARFVLVLEKYTVFYRVVQSGFLRSMPGVLVTGRGFPDVSTRAFVRLVADTLRVPVLGVCDFNPHGLALMATYATGGGVAERSSPGSEGAAARRLACPALRVVGLLARDVDRMPFQARDLEPFAASDDAAVAALLRMERSAGSVGGVGRAGAPAWRGFALDIAARAREMAARRVKVDLDALAQFGPDFLAAAWLPRVVAPWL